MNPVNMTGIVLFFGRIPLYSYHRDLVLVLSLFQLLFSRFVGPTSFNNKLSRVLRCILSLDIIFPLRKNGWEGPEPYVSIATKTLLYARLRQRPKQKAC